MDETTIFKEIHLRSLYRLLGHQGHYSRVGSLDYSTKEYSQTFLKTEEDLNDYVRNFNGKRNIFISRAYRDSSGAPLGTNCITFDIDPIRKKDTASTNEQHNSALNAGRRILSRFPGGYLASSGNGALLIYRLGSPITNLNEHYKKEKLLVKELQELVGNEVKIDSTSYDEAVIKCIGTQSTKGIPSLRRCSRFIELPIPPYKDCSKLLQRLNEIEAPKVSVVKSFEGDPVHRLHDARGFLEKLGNEKRDNYEEWLKVGMALKEFGIAGLNLWKGWSKTSEKYEEGICETKWATFTETPSVTLASLKYWANSSERKSDNYFEKLFAPKESSDGGIVTGFSELDKALGVLPKGELTTFAARSGFGKTTLACTLAEYWRKQGLRVLYFSTEINQKYVMDKLVSLACGIPLANTLQKDFTEAEKSRIRDYQRQLLQSPIEICDEFQPTPELVKNKVIEHKPDILIFDHISQTGTHHEAIANFTRELKDLTNKEGLVTVMMSMLNEPGRSKDGTESKSIRGDVRGSQEILFLSAIFCMLSNPYEVKGNFQPVDFIITKNRYGLSNMTIPLSVNKSLGKYVDRLPTHEEKVNATNL